MAFKRNREKGDFQVITINIIMETPGSVINIAIRRYIRDIAVDTNADSTVHNFESHRLNLTRGHHIDWRPSHDYQHAAQPIAGPVASAYPSYQHHHGCCSGELAPVALVHS